jgi:spore maturation protein CgeB
MRISFFGSSLVSAYWNGACTYYRGIVRALHARGHEVSFYEPDALERQRHRDIPDPPWARVIVYEVPDARAVRRVVGRAAREAQVLIKASGVGVYDEVLEEAVLAAAGPETLTVFWDVDAPATLARLETDEDEPLRAALPGYDVVLTYGGGDPVVERYRGLGAHDCVPVYNALDPQTHAPAEADRRFAADLSFLGNRLPDREARVDDFFFGGAQHAPARSFLLGGAGWEDRPLPPNVRLVGHVPTAEHNVFYSSAVAVLNVSRETMAANGWSPATRVFEAAGAAACLITDAWEGLETFLEPGEEVLVASDGAEVAELLEQLTPANARLFGERARRRVLAEHTYDRRAELVETVLSGVRA